ncbi:PepSY domain-containing protein [Rhodoblastus acidophilus]|uniref:PepSY domain-containing protein n=1 Tax=Candidatus Rhodoblastus alkanivorans TaxID=2954117 RepID=A0ABS9ZA78_9HYPH|nr:PepSY domain-containing protein [Candidatus Rhodoblastus alkanivorans]MCI4677242.1 PepSY domain-containing protein [Candidatus Rhodoblastus alkanivorans]MCI4684594.1 PepSY domain-containing protein [Candidatus Rhodoblastus alkanivorans]MDI4641916.1 PepSY domain-containing protein [Rhodoblastus acidophilus]
MAILAILVTLVGAASFAHAESVDRPCMTKAGNNYLTVDAFLTKIIDRGYKIRSLEAKDGCAKLHAVDKNGGEDELFVDLTSGAAAGESAREID